MTITFASVRRFIAANPQTAMCYAVLGIYTVYLLQDGGFHHTTQLSLIAVVTLCVGIGCTAFAAIGAVAALKAHQAVDYVTMAKGSMRKYALRLHLGLTLTMVGMGTWSIIAMIIFNIGLIPTYVGLIGMCKTMDTMPLLAPEPWAKLALEFGLFAGGVGIVALATAF